MLTLWIVLIPSPLLGPASWGPVRDELAAKGWESLVVDNADDRIGREPCWAGAVAGIEEGLREVADSRTVVLVGHSGAGPLLPAVGRAIRQQVAAYLFMDAGLSVDGRSRVEAIANEGVAGAAFARELKATIDRGGRYPEWGDEDLELEVPDAERRRQLVAKLRPRGREFWTEPLPTVAGWPDAPCAYLLFSAAYQSAAGRANALGRPVRHLRGSHFHHLVDERAVADVLVGLLAETGVPSALDR
jgi:hypothetical protein